MSPAARALSIGLVAASALASAGCLLPTHGALRVHHRHEGHHAWTYYPSHDLYFCRSHRHYAHRAGGRWVHSARVGVVLGEGVTLDLGIAEPWHHGHVWDYHPGPGIYRCRTHGHTWVHGSRGWALHPRHRGPLGPGVRIEHRGHVPYRARPPRRSLPASSPRVALGQRGKSREAPSGTLRHGPAHRRPH